METAVLAGLIHPQKSSVVPGHTTGGFLRTAAAAAAAPVECGRNISGKHTHIRKKNIARNVVHNTSRKEKKLSTIRKKRVKSFQRNKKKGKKRVV